MTNPKISVVMSVYNAEKFLIKAVNSILEQSYTHFEFIILEDASTDGSRAILEELARMDNRIVLIKKEKNKGPAGFIENLNLGLSLAKGQYIARMDADDISDLSRFEQQVDFLDQNPDVFIVGSQLQMIDENDQPISIKSAPTDDKDIQNLMYNNISMYHPVIMFRNNNLVKYREKMVFCEDYDLYFQIMTKGLKMANINKCLLQYRLLDKSMSRQQDKVIKNLFINQAKTFYKERLQNKNDAYDIFKPEMFLNIYQNPSKEVLQKAINVSKLYYDFNGFKKLMNLYKNTFKIDFYFSKNAIFLQAKGYLFNLYSEIYNKLILR